MAECKNALLGIDAQNLELLGPGVEDGKSKSRSLSPATSGTGCNSTKDKELLAHLIEEDIQRMTTFFEEEDSKVEKRLANRIYIERKVSTGTRVTGIVESKLLFICTGKGTVDAYNVQSLDLVKLKTIASRFV